MIQSGDSYQGFHKSNCSARTLLLWQDEHDSVPSPHPVPLGPAGWFTRPSQLVGKGGSVLPGQNLAKDKGKRGRRGSTDPEV